MNLKGKCTHIFIEKLMTLLTSNIFIFKNISRVDQLFQWLHDLFPLMYSTAFQFLG